MQVVGFPRRVRPAVPDDAGLDRLPDVLDAVLTCGGVVADAFWLQVQRR
jgi:hypothetical protein